MVDGSISFDKIQIREVTSHFRNGWIFMVVLPKFLRANHETASAVKESSNAYVIDPNLIKPLIIERIVVKAKKYKDKDLHTAEKDLALEMPDEQELCLD